MNAEDIQRGMKDTAKMSQREIDEYADQVKERTVREQPHDSGGSNSGGRFMSVFIYVVGIIAVAHIAFSNFVTMQHMNSLEAEINAANTKLEAQEETITGLEQEVSTLERNITLLQDQVRELGGTPNVGFWGDWTYGYRYAPKYRPLQ